MPSKKILIVDDDEDVRHGLNMRLRASGYDTVFAVDGISAISVAKREQPDVVLLDLGLPAGDGFLVMQRLKANPALGCIPVIVVSCRDAEDNAGRAIDEGALAYFQKPAANSDLLGAIGEAIGSP